MCTAHNCVQCAYQQGRLDALKTYRETIENLMNSYSAFVEQIERKLRYLNDNATEPTRAELGRLLHEFNNTIRN